jgi:hypothetical protein
MITLHYNNTSIDIHEDDSSYRYRALMQKPQLILKFSLAEYIEFPVGTWCEYQNARFKIFYPQNIKKSGTRDIEYTMTFGQDEEYMGLYKLRNSVDKRLKWSMCAKPHEFIEEIVKNLNEKEGGDGWSVGECIEANEQTIEFNHSYIDAALQSVADAFETEWEIVDKKISLHKVEYFKDDPLPLSYGKGNGFIPGVGRTSQSSEQPIKRLYVQGGEDNIDRSKYGSQYLLLPKSQTLEYEGRTYKTDADGLYIERIDKISDAVKEDSLDCDEFYPSRVGKVLKTENPDKDKNFYDIIDTSIPADLNINDYVIAGENATIIFQSGMLAGREFEFKYKHAERRFELVPMEEDGQTFPNDTFKPKAWEYNEDGSVKEEGDTYAIFGIMLPQSYICDNTAKEGASWDMFREAVKYLYEHEEQQFTFTGTLQGLWSKRNWLRVGGRLKVGGYVLFSDTQFAKDGASIRITGIKDYINSPYSPTIELSSSVSGSTLNSDLSKIDKTEVVIDETKKDIVQYTKRRFRDAKETMTMLNNSLLNYSHSVSPITVQTMAMLVGDESLQFRFVSSKDKLTPIEYQITYDNEKKQLNCPHGFLQHMTLGISTISSTHTDNEYKVWEMAEYESPVLDDDSKKYYLYAKVSRTNTNIKGDFTLSEIAIDMDAEDGSYYLLVGILNSVYEDERSYVNLYGYTEILPSRITTDKIVSADGKSWLDLATGAMKLGDKLSYVDDVLYLDFLFVNGAHIGDWRIKDGKIVSTLEQGNVITLDALRGLISLETNTNGGEYNLGSNSYGSKISLSLDNGTIEVRAKNSPSYSTGTAYMSPTGIFANLAETDGMPSSSGYTQRGAIVGLGFANLNKRDWSMNEDESLVAGVYGRASNDGTAPAYGGFFYNLKACGFAKSTFYFTDSKDGYSLSKTQTTVIGLINKDKTNTIYLPSNAYEGMEVEFIQMGQGVTRIDTKDGTHIYDDDSENEYYDCPCGWVTVCRRVTYSINKVNYDIWAVHQYHFK